MFLTDQERDTACLHLAVSLGEGKFTLTPDHLWVELTKLFSGHWTLVVAIRLAATCVKKFFPEWNCGFNLTGAVPNVE